MEMWSICKWQNIFWRSRAQPSSSSEPGARVYVCEWYTCTCTCVTRTFRHVHTCLTGPRVETRATDYSKIDNYPNESRGISPDNELTRGRRLAKIRRHSSSLSRIIDLLPVQQIDESHFDSNINCDWLYRCKFTVEPSFSSLPKIVN